MPFGPRRTSACPGGQVKDTLDRPQPAARDGQIARNRIIAGSARRPRAALGQRDVIAARGRGVLIGSGMMPPSSSAGDQVAGGAISAPMPRNNVDAEPARSRNGRTSSTRPSQARRSAVTMTGPLMETRGREETGAVAVPGTAPEKSLGSIIGIRGVPEGRRHLIDLFRPARALDQSRFTPSQSTMFFFAHRPWNGHRQKTPHSMAKQNRRSVAAKVIIAPSASAVVTAVITVRDSVSLVRFMTIDQRAGLTQVSRAAGQTTTVSFTE